MKREFIPYEQALELKELGFNEKCFAAMDMYSNIDYGSEMYDWIKNGETVQSTWAALPLYQQAFRWFREKYNFKYSIGITNICVYHISVSNYHTTFMLQDCESYEDAQLQCIKAFIDHAKQK